MSTITTVRTNQQLTNLEPLVKKTELSFNEKNITPEQEALIEKFKTTLDYKDSNTILQYGVGAQKDLSDFTGTLLAKVKTKDVGVVGNILADLSVQVKKVDTKSLIASKTGLLESLPLIGGFFDDLKKFKAKYQTVETNVNDITDRLEREYEVMTRDIITYDELYKENAKYFYQLEILIFAAKSRIKELSEELVKKEAEAAVSKDQMQIQEVENLRHYTNQLETRVHDLELTRISTLQSFPQINLIKAGDQGLAVKIQSAILNTIPLWKRHITIAIGLYNQKQVVDDLKDVDKATDDLLNANASLMKENATTVAKTLQRGIISVETLENVQNKLIESIDEVRKIIEEGKEQRKQATVRIGELETELKEKLLEAKK